MSPDSVASAHLSAGRPKAALAAMEAGIGLTFYPLQSDADAIDDEI